jgi:predicted phosphodiesterase
MRIAIFSDVHGRRLRLEQLLEETASYDERWCLGDTLGWYGEDGLGALRLVREHCRIVLAGNHDLAIAGMISRRDFSAAALVADEPDRRALAKDSELKAYARSLPSQVEVDLPGLGLMIACHGTPRDPIWEYANASNAAMILNGLAPARLALYGHTHLPRGWRLRRELARPVREIHQRVDRPIALTDDPTLIGVGALSFGRRPSDSGRWLELDTDQLSLTPRRLRPERLRGIIARRPLGRAAAP